VNPKLAIEFVRVLAHRAGTDEQSRRDLPVGQPLRQERQDLGFAVGQRIDQSFCFSGGGLPGADLSASARSPRCQNGGDIVGRYAALSQVGRQVGNPWPQVHKEAQRAARFSQADRPLQQFEGCCFVSLRGVDQYFDRKEDVVHLRRKVPHLVQRRDEQVVLLQPGHESQ